MEHHIKIFIKTIYFKGSSLENKPISGEIIGFWVRIHTEPHFFNHLNSYDKENSEIFIKTLLFFRNKKNQYHHQLLLL